MRSTAVKLNLDHAHQLLHEALALVSSGHDVPEALLQALVEAVQAVVDALGSLSDEDRAPWRVQLLDLAHGHDELVAWLRMHRDRIAEELSHLDDVRYAEQSYAASLNLASLAV